MTQAEIAKLTGIPLDSMDYTLKRLFASGRLAAGKLGQYCLPAV